MWISNSETKIINDNLRSNSSASKSYTFFLYSFNLEIAMNNIDWVWFVKAPAKMEILSCKVDDLADRKVEFNYYGMLHQLQKSPNIRLWSRLSGINSRRTFQKTDPGNYESCWSCRNCYFISSIFSKLHYQMGYLIKANTWNNF